MKIVQFDPLASQRDEVIKMAEGILQDAKAGKIVDLSYAAACVDGSMVSGFSRTEDAPRRLAAVSRLLHRLHLSWDEP